MATAAKIDGKYVATELKRKLAQPVHALARCRAVRDPQLLLGVLPGLGTILVGDDPSSHSYVAGKHRDCAEGRSGLHPYRAPGLVVTMQPLGLGTPESIAGVAVFLASDASRHMTGSAVVTDGGSLALGRPAPSPT